MRAVTLLPPGVAPTLGAAVLWGTSFPVNRHGLETIDAATFAWIRFTIAAVAGVALALALREFDMAPYVSRRTWLFAVFNAVAFTFQYEGQARTTAGKSALLVNASVIFVGVLSFLIYRERFPARKLGAVALGLAGVALITTGGSLSDLRGGEFAGDVLVLLAGMSWAFYLVLNKEAVAPRRGIMNMTAALMVATSVLMLPRALASGDLGALRGGWDAWWPALYTGVACSTAAYYVWSRGLVHLSPTTSAVVLLFEVLVALVLSLLFLGETINAAIAAGAVMLAVAIVLVTREEEGVEEVHPA